MAYKLLAVKLTEFENHRTMSAFQDALILKLVVFEFFNYNCSLFHIAFYKQDLPLLRYQIMMLMIVFQAPCHTTTYLAYDADLHMIIFQATL